MQGYAETRYGSYLHFLETSRDCTTNVYTIYIGIYSSLCVLRRSWEFNHAILVKFSFSKLRVSTPSASPSRMEVAGLVLGGIPLAIAALKCFKTGKRLSDLIRNRKRHIETLIRALEGYNGYLELLLEWLLKSVDMDMYAEGKYHAQSNISYLMQNAETIERMREFLGPKPLSASQGAINNGQEAVVKIATSIDNLLPGNQVRAASKMKAKKLLM